jgi:hypothetical protein
LDKIVSPRRVPPARPQPPIDWSAIYNTLPEADLHDLGPSPVALDFDPMLGRTPDETTH